MSASQLGYWGRDLALESWVQRDTVGVAGLSQGGITGYKSVGMRKRDAGWQRPDPHGLACLLQTVGATAGLSAGDCRDESDNNNDCADNSLLLVVL